MKINDEDSNTMDLAVQKEQLSQAIGRNGQNIRLASEMTGWILNVMTIEEFEAKSKDESPRRSPEMKRGASKDPSFKEDPQTLPKTIPYPHPATAAPRKSRHTASACGPKSDGSKADKRDKTCGDR